ncbi:MAG TPA: hypothetical protein VG322_05125 [Candidatus Acidoferrales bacterium]|jgi:hypothetical protein|nr:hypothetical protein [Candidatus Acidoferrales bacterium]
MSGHLWYVIVSWSNQNEGFITLLGCLLGVPSVFYTGWSIRTYVVQKKKDDIKEHREKAERAQALEQAQWRGIYRVLKEVAYNASVLHANSLQHCEAARRMAAVGRDVVSAYQQAGTSLVNAIGGLMMELTLIPQCQETLAIVEFFGIKYPSAESRASGEFSEELQTINTMVLAKAGGKPLELPGDWKDKFNSGIAKKVGAESHRYTKVPNKPTK